MYIVICISSLQSIMIGSVQHLLLQNSNHSQSKAAQHPSNCCSVKLSLFCFIGYHDLLYISAVFLLATIILCISLPSFIGFHYPVFIAPLLSLANIILCIYLLCSYWLLLSSVYLCHSFSGYYYHLYTSI